MTPKAVGQRAPSTRDFFLNLSASRAFVLFLGALVLAGVSIADGWGLPWAPGVPVLAYGAVLFYCQSRLYVRLDESTKDSPYFLGFLLTLGALMKVLFQLNAGAQPPDGGQSVVQGGAGAIWPTLVGLFMRQALWSRDPGEDERETVFKSLREQLREHASNFDLAQKRLIILITEFVDSREKLFGREEQAFTKYVKTLEGNWTKLDQLAQAQARQVEDTGKALDASTLRLTQSSTSAATSIQSAGQALSSRLRDLDALMIQMAQTLDEKTRAIASAGSSLGAIAATMAATNADLQAYRSSWQAASAEIRTVSSSLNAIPSDLKKAAATAAGEIVTLHSDLASKLRQISDDVRAIDEILDQLTTLLRARLTNLTVQQ